MRMFAEPSAAQGSIASRAKRPKEREHDCFPSSMVIDGRLRGNDPAQEPPIGMMISLKLQTMDRYDLCGPKWSGGAHVLFQGTQN